MSTVARISEGDGDPRHGTENGYGNLKCRCPDCTAAHARKCYEYEQKRNSRPLAIDDPRHGTPNLYGNYRCRCRPCTDAWTRDTMERRNRRRAS